MGEPNIGNLYYPKYIGGRHCKLKYLSSNGKEIKRDSLSSDERNGKSLNHEICIVSFCTYGVIGIICSEANKLGIVYSNKRKK